MDGAMTGRGSHLRSFDEGASKRVSETAIATDNNDSKLRTRRKRFLTFWSPLTD
jgi:hypothetical protein